MVTWGLHGSNLFFQNIPQMLNRIEITGNWRLMQDLELIIMFLTHFLNNLSLGQALTVPLKRLDLQQGKWRMSHNIHMKAHIPRFPVRVLLRASHCLHRLTFLPKCILVSSLPWVNDTLFNLIWFILIKKWYLISNYMLWVLSAKIVPSASKMYLKVLNRGLIPELQLSTWSTNRLRGEAGLRLS